MPTLRQLQPGTRFRQPQLGVRGILLKCNDCRALVRIDRPAQEIEICQADGTRRQFVARRYEITSWAPTVWVEADTTALGFSIDERHEIMAAKKTAKKTTRKTARPKPAKGAATKPAAKKPAAKKKVASKKPVGKMSALDAAAKVLAESKEPLSTREMVEQMAAKGYWSSPGGKTPHATLYSAILREIQKKGGDARFKKVERGRFERA